MTQYVINIGTLPNDGTGDPLRTAFNEVNLNFDQVFAAGPVLSNIQMANNTILTTNTNGNLVLAPNGIGVVQANVNIVPNSSNIRNLGSADRRWSTLYIQYANISGSITVSDLTATGNVTVGGNLSVTGNIINVANIITDAKTIQLANTAGSANAANGSGITVGANDAIATFLFDSANNVWSTNIGLGVGGPITGTSLAVSDATIYGNLNGIDSYFTGTVTAPNIVVNKISSDDSTFVTISDGLNVQGDITASTLSVIGNVTGNYFIGNGSQLTGLYANANVVAYGQAGWAGNIVPAASNTYSLGNSTLWWSNIWVAGNTIYIGGVALGMGAGNVLTVGGNAVLQNDSNTTISTTGNITADYFFGNGSQLTGLNTSSISNGSSNVDIATANGNITVTANGTYTWSFEDTGTLNFPSSPASIYGGMDNDFTINTANSNAATYTFTFSQLGDLTVPVNLYVIENLYADNIVGPGNGNVTVTANTESWLFETDGRLFLPNSGVINASGNSVDIGSEDAISLEANTVVNIYTDTNGAGHQWQFGDAGELTLPASSEILEVANPGGFPGYAMALVPDPDNAIDADQQLLIYPTGGVDANHLHLTSGNLYNTELFLGNDDLYVKLANTGNIVVNTNDNGGNFAQWTFDNTGNINLPTNGSINFNAGGIVQKPDEDFVITVNDADDDGFAIFNRITDENGNVMAETEMQRDRLNIILDVQGAGYQWQFSDNGQLYLPGNISGNYGASTSFYATDNGSGGSMEMKTISYIGDTLGSNIRVTQSNATISTSAGAYTWTFDNTGTLTAPGNVSAGNFVGAGSNVDIVAGSYNWTFDNTGNLTLPGNTFAVNYANGTAVSLGGSYGNANVANFLAAYGSNTISTTGNITTGVISATAINLSSTGTAVNAGSGNILTNRVTGTQFAFLNGIYTAVLTGAGATANYTLNLPANVGSNGQSLTSDGTGNLIWTTPASSYGNANVATFLAAFGSNTISTTGNVTAANFIGNIEITGNISGTSANVELVAGVYEWTFDNTGNLTLPGNTFAVNYANGTAVSLDGAGSYGNANVADFLDSLGSNAIVTTGNITGGNVIATANILGNGYARLTGSFDESQASTAGLYLGYAGGTARIMFGTGNTSQTLEIDNDGGTLRFYKPGTTLASLTNSGAFSAAGNITGANIVTSGSISATGNITAANLGNIANINLNGNSSQVLYGNGVFAAVAGGSYGDANVATFLGTYGSNTISSTGNITTTATANVGTLAVTGNATVSGTGSNLIRRASGLVAADTNVTLDDLSANVTSSGSQLAISTSGSWQGTGWTESFVGAGVSVQNWVNLPMNPGYAFASQAMNSQGHGCRCVISDQTPTAKVYQITVVRSGTTGAQWNITIERLV